MVKIDLSEAILIILYENGFLEGYCITKKALLYSLQVIVGGVVSAIEPFN